MIVKFYTFGQGHLVSDREFDALKTGFAKVGMELVRKEDPRQHDITMVKGFSHTYEEVPKDRPLVLYSIGTDFRDNKPLEDLYRYADAVVSISTYCKEQIEEWWFKDFNSMRNGISVVIPPAREPNLPKEQKPVHKPLKLATTCIPRPVKRVEETERLCKKYGIELVPAFGSTSDFSYYHDCDGYIHLSRKEGMPNTVLEALAYGLPCIVTNHGGAKEAVGDAGIVIHNDPDYPKWQGDIEPVDDYLFKEALDLFVANIDALRNNVRRRVLTLLNDRISASQFKEVFERIIKMRNERVLKQFTK